MSTYRDDAAFARSSSSDPNGYIEYATPGLTKREYFAALALIGIISTTRGIDATDRAKAAVSHGDALIAELNKEPGR